MLFRTKDLEAIFAGRVTTAFRRWRRPTVKPGGTVRTQLGLIAIDTVEEIDPGQLTEADAEAANYPDLESLLGMFLAQEGTCYRITLHPSDALDPRDVLRNTTELTEADRAAISTKLTKLDANAPWTRATLAAIAEQPGVVSTKLAAGLGVERPVFKENVRKLKALGLTESLETGYRLSPRGKAYLGLT